jgi:hypothetical protein
VAGRVDPAAVPQPARLHAGGAVVAVVAVRLRKRLLKWDRRENWRSQIQ